MPEHASFFSYLVALFPALGENVKGLKTVIEGRPMTLHSFDPLFAAAFVAIVVLLMAFKVRSDLRVPGQSGKEKAILPEQTLTLRTFMELFIAYFYDLMKDMMGAKRAKQYFPLIGTCALFIFVSNFMGMIPGFNPPTSSWSITLGCALIVFVAFNYYGLKENGLGYIKHLAGPVWWLAWLIFPLEVFSLFLRPATLSFRLMINMAVDHMLLGVVTGLVMVIGGLVLPIPIMVLGTIVAAVQVLVFCLLSSIYITLATEHEHDHEPVHS
jgi:F-type H+-transporting ATPase subunit a